MPCQSKMPARNISPIVDFRPAGAACLPKTQNGPSKGCIAPRRISTIRRRRRNGASFLPAILTPKVSWSIVRSSGTDGSIGPADRRHSAAPSAMYGPRVGAAASVNDMPERRGRFWKRLRGTSANGSSPAHAYEPTAIWKAPTLREIIDPARDRGSPSATDATSGGIGRPGDASSVHCAREPTRSQSTPGGRGNSTNPNPARFGFVAALARWRARKDFESWLESGRYERRCPATKLPKVRIVDLPTNDYSEG